MSGRRKGSGRGQGECWFRRCERERVFRVPNFPVGRLCMGRWRRSNINLVKLLIVLVQDHQARTSRHRKRGGTIRRWRCTSECCSRRLEPRQRTGRCQPCQEVASRLSPRRRASPLPPFIRAHGEHCLLIACQTHGRRCCIGSHTVQHASRAVKYQYELCSSGLEPSRLPPSSPNPHHHLPHHPLRHQHLHQLPQNNRSPKTS